MEFLESILLDPSSITFTVLFVGLFVYVMRQNENRESHYRETIETLSTQLKECQSTNRRNDI
jgi:BhlA holin family